MPATWSQILDSSVAETHAWARDLSLAPDMSAYARALSFYLQGDRERLAALAQETAVGNPSIQHLIEIRLKVRGRTVRPPDLERLESVAIEGVLEAEKHFCLAMGWELQGRNDLCAKHFTKAANVYRAADCPRKALRAFYNAIAAESRVNPHKNYVSEYQAVIQLSAETGETVVEGMALTMLAREYQIAGLFDAACEMAERGVRLLESERGSLHFAHALLQKAHVLLDLGRDREIPPLLTEAEMAPFAEIRAAARLLRVATEAGAVWDRKWEKDLLPTWRNRIPQLTTRVKVGEGARPTSELEQRLLKIVYNGPVEKWDLIERLYPEGGAPVALENRLKNLLGRVRKKYPQQIICQEGRYSLAQLPGELT